MKLTSQQDIPNRMSRPRSLRSVTGLVAAVALLLTGLALSTRTVAAADPTVSLAPAPVCCGDPLPDLVITGFSSCEGVCVVVKNRNAYYRAGAFSVKFDSHGRPAQYLSVAGLAPGASTTVRFNSPGCAGGEGQSARARVDALNQVKETNELNNTADWSNVC